MHSSFRLGRRVAVGARPLRQLAAAALCIAQALIVVEAKASGPWPVVALPADAVPFPLGEQVAVNGMPLRMQGFVSRLGQAQLAEGFRQRLGKPLMEDRIRGKLILGRAQGEYYISVQLDPLGPGQPGTRGVVAVSHLQAAYDKRLETRAGNERLLTRLPAGSRLLSQMSSNDGGKLASYAMLANNYTEEVNRDRIVAMLREDGLVLEREARADAKARDQLPAGLKAGRTLFFKASGKEAMAVIHRDAAGETTVLLNTITYMENLK